MSRIVRWETPFADEFYPSVLPVAYPGARGIQAKVLVSGKSDMWYAVDFGDVLVCNIMDEGCCPHREFGEAVFDPSITSDTFVASLKWLDSPWLKSYEPCHDPYSDRRFTHYLVFGGDTNLEVICSNEPTITLISPGEHLQIKHDIDPWSHLPSNRAAK
jgi:hypothetical protein